MGRNIEIKARARNFERQRRIAEEIGNGPARHLIQEDTFFNVPAGRLKLRALEDGSGELIQYYRVDSTGPAESRYRLYPTGDPESLKDVLAAALGTRAVVRKQRTVHLVGPTRIHLDRVEGLGDFVELEVVLEPDQGPEEGVRTAEGLMSKLQIEEPDLIRAAYVDLLEAQGRRD